MPTDEQLRLNLAPDQLGRAAASYADSGFAQIDAPFAPAVAQAVHDHLAHEVEWWRIVNRGERTWDLGPESINKLDQDGDAELLKAVHAGARDGFQFLFDAVRVSDEPADRAARGWLIDRVITALNHPSSLETFRQITGDPAVRIIDGQATRYLPGHFLTSHDDAVDGKNRVAAYVINVTLHWRTEWGGLLQFHDPCGNLRCAYKPQFNVINLFQVPQLHSVSLVAPFAGAPRYAITGWARR